MKKAGIIIMLIGLGLTFFTGFTYFTKEKVVAIGNIEVTRNQPHHFNISLMIGIAVMCIGGAFIWQSNKK